MNSDFLIRDDIPCCKHPHYKYRFFQSREQPVVPTLSICGDSSLSRKELEEANNYVSHVLCPREGESAKLTP